MLRDKNTSICGAAKISCFQLAEASFQRQTLLNLVASEQSRACNCLPSCNSITYDAEILQYPVDDIDIERNQGIHLADLHVYFKESEFITLSRSELYGLVDFIANCGGLMGLFVGASFLSIFELFYYCSLKLFCNIRRKMKRKHIITDSTLPEIIIVRQADE